MSEPSRTAVGSHLQAGEPTPGTVSPGAATPAILSMVKTAALVAFVLVPATTHAAERNPFTEAVDPPRTFLASAWFGSHHRDGYGVALGVVPVDWLQVEVSGAYRYELSLAAIVRVLPFPRSALTPFVSAGANRATSRLPGRLGYTTFSLIGTAGLQTRVAGRWFLGAEVAMLYELSDTAKVGKTTTTFTPSDRIDVVPGAFFGAYFP